MLSVNITNTPESVAAFIKAGQLGSALTRLQDEVRANGSAPSLRLLLVQLLCVMGQWDRARAQLQVLDSLDEKYRPFVGVVGQALTGEALRREVFSGNKTPMILGEPPAWIAGLVQAMSRTVEPELAVRQRAEAFENAPATPGTLNGKPFEWLADADSRLGPVIEILMEGKYYWAPFDRITRIAIEPPTDLRHLVWLPARFTWTTGGESSAWIPCRYPASETSGDDKIRLARLTTWEEFSPGNYRGVGQRMLASNVEEYPFLEVRLIEFRHG